MNEKVQEQARQIASGPGLTDPMRAALASMLSEAPGAGASTWFALDRRGLVRWDPRAEGGPRYILVEPLGRAVAEILRAEGWRGVFET